MKNILLTTLFLFVSIHFISAQHDESYKLYKMESIYLKGNKYIKNDVAYPVGFLGSNLANEMRISEHATAEWNKFVTNRNWSMATSITSVALAIATLQVEDPNLRAGLAIGALGVAIISIPISIKAGNQYQKAIWTRNRDLFQ